VPRTFIGALALACLSAPAALLPVEGKFVALLIGISMDAHASWLIGIIAIIISRSSQRVWVYSADDAGSRDGGVVDSAGSIGRPSLWPWRSGLVQSRELLPVPSAILRLETAAEHLRVDPWYCCCCCCQRRLQHSIATQHARSNSIAGSRA